MSHFHPGSGGSMHQKNSMSLGQYETTKVIEIGFILSYLITLSASFCAEHSFFFSLFIDPKKQPSGHRHGKTTEAHNEIQMRLVVAFMMPSTGAV